MPAGFPQPPAVHRRKDRRTAWCLLTGRPCWAGETGQPPGLGPVRRHTGQDRQSPLRSEPATWRSEVFHRGRTAGSTWWGQGTSSWTRRQQSPDDRREVRPPAAPPSFLPSVEWGQSKQSNPSQLPGPQPLLTGPCSCPLSPLFPPETGREGGLPRLSVSHLCASFYLQLNRRDCGILSSGPAQRAAFGEKGVPTQ